MRGSATLLPSASLVGGDGKAGLPRVRLLGALAAAAELATPPGRGEALRIAEEDEADGACFFPFVADAAVAAYDACGLGGMLSECAKSQWRCHCEFTITQQEE